jgi:hypothetical protein
MGIISKENKLCYLMGDFNLNLLNHHTHQLTAEFVDIMQSCQVQMIKNLEVVGAFSS